MLGRLSSDGTHPDLVVLHPEGTGLKPSIKIEIIRTLLQRLSLRPFGSHEAGGVSHVVVLIEEAEALTDGAANALLKTLEEPPEGVLFILITTAEERLPSTLRSRCQKIRFQLTTASLRSGLASHWESWREDLQPLLTGRPSFGAASHLAESIAEDGTRLPSLFTLLKTLWHDLAVYRETADDSTLFLSEARGWITEQSRKKSTERILGDLDGIDETERAIEGNVHKTLALERMFMKLMSA